MSEGKDVFEFLSRCWVPFIALEHGIYYAFGNTRMLDFLRDFKVNSKMDILVLGLGDVRHVMKTVAGLSQRPPSSFGEVKEIHFNLNDVDKDVIARDIILLEITNKLDPESKSDAEFLWSVWYNAFMVEKDFRRLNVILEDLIDKYSNSSRDSERICEFGDKLSLKSVLKTWNCWMKRKLNQSAVKQSRLESLEFDAKIKPFSYNDIAQYASMQVYVDRGIKDSDVEIVGKEMLTAARDGFVNFSEDRKKDRKDFANPTFMRPGCEEWLVEDGACAAACYLPLQKKFIEKHSSIHEACFEKMRETISSYHETWKMVKVTYTLWATDLFHLCHWLMPSDMKFDFIFTSNLMDYVGLINLLLITQPRLKNSQSVLVTESFNWNKFYKTLEELLNKDLMCNYMHLPSMIGLRMAEDLDLGISHLQGFYRTTISRLSDSELIYWTKSFNQENIRIDLEASPEVKYALFFLLASTFWSNSTAAALSRIKQTPLALMYCFQRLQNLIKGGMATLLEYVELEINGRTMDFSRNRMTWDVVCWAFGQKHKGDQLCIVKIPFKDVNSSLTAMITHGKVNCRLKLEYDTSSSKEEVLSLFQYDAVDQHFRVPILESAWKALPDSTTMMVINRDGENSPPLHQLSRPNRKVPFKKEGIVVATYYEQKRYDAATTDSFLFQTLFCSEEAEKYRMQDAFVEAKASLDLWCKLIVSDSNNDMAAESTAVAKFPYIFSCPVVSYEIYDVRENFIQAALYKQKFFNTGRTALPFRLIDDSELLPFTCGQDIRNYLEKTMICDLMFCSPTDIESRATALSGPVLLTDDAFLTLRIIIEQLWHLGSKREKTLPHVVRVEIQEQTKTSPVMILDVQGYYMYGGLPLVKMRFVELDINSADLKTSKEATTIYAKYPRCLELLKKMLFTNSLRMSQERLTASVNITASSSQSLNTFLQMVFLSDDGRVMKSALHEYPINTCLVKNYIEKIYSASIRQNFVAPRIARDILGKQMKESISSYFAERPQFPSGEHKPDSATSKNLSSLPLNQRTSCSECKKSTIDLKKCSRCMSVAYCSKDCQVKDWPKHKNECSSDLFKTDDSSSTNRSNESGCPTEPKNLSGSLIKKSITLDTNKPRIKVASSTKKIENDPSTKAKIEYCFSVGSNSEDSSVIYRRESKTNSEEDSALKPKTEYCISNSKNPDCGASAKTEDGDHSFALEANDAISYLESAFEDSAKAYKSSLQSKFQANNSAKKKNEVDSSLKDMNPSQSHLQKIKTNFQNDAIADNWVGLRSGELCTYCRLENSNMKKCVQCKSAAYCSRECQRADWKRHMSECQTQQFPSTVPLMSRCNSCGALGTEMKKCSQCKSTCYCSPECQRRDWKTHKITCRRP